MGIEVMWHRNDLLRGAREEANYVGRCRHFNGGGDEDGNEVLELELDQFEEEQDHGDESDEEEEAEYNGGDEEEGKKRIGSIDHEATVLYLMPPLPLVGDESSASFSCIDLTDNSSTHPRCHRDADKASASTMKNPADPGAASRTGVLSRVFDLLKSFKPGSDLTRFQVPVQLNMPKSQLQMYGESVYCCRNELLRECARGSTPLQRFMSVVAWHISTTRLGPFGQAPFNPVLGETHHVSAGNLNVLLEQVSHHPPVTALYASDQVDNLRLQWSHNACPRFYGNKVEVAIHGKRTLWLDSHEESYEMTTPRLSIRLFPAPGNEWVGSTTVKCDASGYEATLNFKPKPFLGLRGSLGQVSGEIWDKATDRLLFELHGHWNKVVSLKDVKTKKTTVLFDALNSLTKLKAPIVRDVKEVASTESLMVWRHVMEGMLKKDWELARQAKNEIEVKHREQRRLRNKSHLSWMPQHFELKENQWQWRHSSLPVPPAPLVIPSS